jgi:hypothetical protein
MMIVLRFEVTVLPRICWLGLVSGQIGIMGRGGKVLLALAILVLECPRHRG